MRRGRLPVPAEPQGSREGPMAEDVALVGNDRVLGRVRANGVLEDVFFPSKGFHRHILRSQFGVYLFGSERMEWFAQNWPPHQEYLEDTFVAETQFRHPEGLEARLLDFVPPGLDVFIRHLELRNTRSAPQSVAVVHAEASALEENIGEFDYNSAYVNRSRRVMRYRGHPFDNTREAHCCVLVEGTPEPHEFQVGRSFCESGRECDAFFDAGDGRLEGNELCSGEKAGATTAMLWRLNVAPGQTVKITVVLAGGSNTREAEECLRRFAETRLETHLDQTRRFWRSWLATAEPALKAIPTVRLRRLARRSLLVLKLLQHEHGALLAAPTLHPDYRYCWPRDAAYMAWILSRFGYRAEADRFFRWAAETQMASGFWHQNYYTDGRPHWTTLQMDQVGTILWALGEHLAGAPDRSLAQELWPMVRAAADAMRRSIDPATGLLSSPQCLWEECGGTFAYTNAACIAGMRAAAQIAERINLPLARSTYADCAAAMLKILTTSYLHDGEIAAELHPHRSYEARDRYVQDISVLGLAVPYGLVDPDWPPLVHTADRFSHAFSWPAGGLGRYPGDRFEGGNPWPLCSMWMSAYWLSAGESDKALPHLEWALEQVTPLDHFPEQVHHNSGHLVSALPLGWAHGWYLWNLMLLYPECAGRRPAGKTLQEARRG